MPTTDSEIFDTFLRNYPPEYGGPLGYEVRDCVFMQRDQLGGITQALGYHTIEPVKALWARLPPIYIGVNECPSINAFAFENQGRYFISINGGTITGFFVVFNLIMLDPRLLTHIGDVSVESQSSPLLDGFNPFDCSYPLSQDLLPKCATRQAYAFRLFENAMRFLFLHEVMHIAEGHVDYCNSLHLIPLLCEVSPPSGAEMDDLLSGQAMEIMADSHWISLLGHAVVSHTKAVPDLGMPDAIFRAVFSLCAFFRVFGDQGFTGYDMSDEHPPPRFRQVIALERGYSLLKHMIKQDDLKACQQAFNDAVNAVEDIFPRLIRRTKKIAGLSESITPEARELKQKLIHHADNILRPILKPFAYGPDDDTVRLMLSKATQIPPVA